MNQQLPVLRSKHGSRVCSSLLSDAWAVGTRCCHDRLWSQAAMGSEEDVQQMSTAKRLSLLTIKAHECTVQYEQVSAG